jgi:hypothetical protein
MAMSFESLQNNKESDSVVIQKLLNAELQKDNPAHFSTMLQKISTAFENGTVSENKEIILQSISDIKNAENYLGEKYRDTKDEQEYLTIVDRAITFLENRLKLAK